MKRSALVIAALAVPALAACSLLTSWDDVQVGGDDGGVMFETGASGADSSIGHPVVDGSGPVADAGRDAGDGACTMSGTFFCYDAGTAWFLDRCMDPDSDLEVPVCDGQCVVNQPFADDSCACTPGKDYCGFHSNGQDPMSLWTCSNANGVFTLKETCPKDCLRTGQTSLTHPTGLAFDACE